MKNLQLLSGYGKVQIRLDGILWGYLLQINILNYRVISEMEIENQKIKRNSD